MSNDGADTEDGQIPLTLAHGGQVSAFGSALARVPPSFFAISFGLAGLAIVWRLMTSAYNSPAAVADILFLASGVVLALLVAGSLRRALRTPREVLGELHDPVLSPFWALPGMPRSTRPSSMSAICYRRWLVGSWALSARRASACAPSVG